MTRPSARLLSRLVLLGSHAGIRPDASAHVSGAGGEVLAARAWCDGNDRVLVTLEHDLGVAGPGVPELDTAVLGTGHDPLGIGGQSDTEDEVLKNIVVSSYRTIYEDDHLPCDPRMSSHIVHPWDPGESRSGAEKSSTPTS